MPQLSVSHVPPLFPPLPERPPFTIGLLTPHNARDRRTFSGTAFYAAQALQNLPGIRCKLLGGPHKVPSRLDRFFPQRQTRVPLHAEDVADVDVVVGLVATGLLEELRRVSDTPYVHVTDATPSFLREAYGWDIPLEADVSERRVAEAADAVIYSSEFMARRAQSDLGLVGPRTHAVPFGINLSDTPDILPRKLMRDSLNLLFVGANWERKGGDTAVAALDHLAALGQNATLTIVGSAPEGLNRHPKIRMAGFLNKNREAERRRLQQLYSEAHVFLLPTRADCTPMVLAEAMAHGTPVFASRTGAVAEMIERSGGGVVMPKEAAGREWASEILRLWRSDDRWSQMSVNGFAASQTQYSWDVWAENIKTIAMGHVIERIAA